MYFVLLLVFFIGLLVIALICFATSVKMGWFRSTFRIRHDHKLFQPTLLNLDWHIDNIFHVFIFAVGDRKFWMSSTKRVSDAIDGGGQKYPFRSALP